MEYSARGVYQEKISPQATNDTITVKPHVSPPAPFTLIGKLKYVLLVNLGTPQILQWIKFQANNNVATLSWPKGSLSCQYKQTHTLAKNLANDCSSFYQYACCDEDSQW